MASEGSRFILPISEERAEKIKSYHCAVEVAVNTIAGKYKAIILYHLTKGTMRYNQIQKLIPQATPQMLSRQLRELEADGIIDRVVYPVVPPKTEYSLTAFGQSITPIVEALHLWGVSFLEAVGIDRLADEK
ncbi:MAG: helix-turn-helix domain-containing protein [Eubacteriales bacterium]|nr:helix-turn-helix domain-containing protein [Eubacteriales bacterium]